MELFNKFRETIFLKEESNLEAQINELKSIREQVPNKEQIDKDIKLLEIGLQGEKEIAYELKHANIGMYVLHDITIPFEDLKAQIDYVIVTKGFCYLVECKNLIGNITVNNDGQFQREYTLNGKSIKEAIYSPYTQAMRHKEILKKRWISKNNKLSVFLKEDAFDKLWYKPLVVLSNSKSILNTKYAPTEVRKNTIRVDQLVDYIKKDIENYDKDILSSKSKMLELATVLLEANEEISKSFVDKYKDSLVDTEELKQKLKKYRKEKSTKMHLPAYYIFKDDELEKILLNMPKTLEELKSLKILSEVKLNLHGKEIIEIINEK